MFECLFIDLFWTFFDIVFSVQDFEAFPKPLMFKREVVVCFLSSGFFPSLPEEIPDWSLSLLAWWSSPLSHLPTGHKALLFEDK